MGDVDLKDLRRECLNSLYLCTDNISTYLDSDKSQECFNDLRDIVKEYCKLDFEENASHKALQAMQQETDLDSLESKYNDELLRQRNVRANFNKHPYMVDLQRHIPTRRAAQNDSDDQDLAITETEDRYIDQITKQPIRIPLRNTICNHVYEKESIEHFIRNKPKKCPYAGCKNTQKVTKEHLVPDEELMQRLASMAQEQSTFEDDDTLLL